MVFFCCRRPVVQNLELDDCTRGQLSFDFFTRSVSFVYSTDTGCNAALMLMARHNGLIRRTQTRTRIDRAAVYEVEKSLLFTLKKK